MLEKNGKIIMKKIFTNDQWHLPKFRKDALSVMMDRLKMSSDKY